MIVLEPARQFALAAAGLAEHSIVAWENLATDAALTGTAILPGGDLFNATNGTTADFWLPDPAAPTALLEVDLGAARSLTCAAIAAHTLAEYGLSVAIERSDDGSTWIETGAVQAPETGAPVFWRFSPVAARYWRLVVTGIAPTDAPAIGIVFFGRETIMPQRLHVGLAPPIVPTEVQIASNVSVGGYLMSSGVVSKGLRFTYEFRNIKPSFTRGPLRPFIRHFNEGGGAFLAWNPGAYAEDILYGWRDGAVINPVNSGPADHQSLTLSGRAQYDW